MKLELKHLAPYLPYRINLRRVSKGHFTCDPDNITTIPLDCFNIPYVLTRVSHVKEIKPILRPLSDLVKEPHNKIIPEMVTHGFHNKFWDNPEACYMYYPDVVKLLENHYDIFGLIEAGLAIDINTLSQNNQ